MTILQITPDLTEIDEKLRLERGPVRRIDVATPDLFLSKKVSSNYFLDGIDAAGNKIERDKEFEFLDKTQRVWYIYAKTRVPKEESTDRFLWKEIEVFAGSQEEALARAQILVADIPELPPVEDEEADQLETTVEN